MLFFLATIFPVVATFSRNLAFVGLNTKNRPTKTNNFCPRNMLISAIVTPSHTRGWRTIYALRARYSPLRVICALRAFVISVDSYGFL